MMAQAIKMKRLSLIFQMKLFWLLASLNKIMKRHEKESNDSTDFN